MQSCGVSTEGSSICSIWDTYSLDHLFRVAFRGARENFQPNTRRYYFKCTFQQGPFILLHLHVLSDLSVYVLYPVQYLAVMSDSVHTLYTQDPLPNEQHRQPDKSPLKHTWICSSRAQLTRVLKFLTFCLVPLPLEYWHWNNLVEHLIPGANLFECSDLIQVLDVWLCLHWKTEFSALVYSHVWSNTTVQLFSIMLDWARRNQLRAFIYELNKHKYDISMRAELLHTAASYAVPVVGTAVVATAARAIETKKRKYSVCVSNHRSGHSRHSLSDLDMNTSKLQNPLDLLPVSKLVKFHGTGPKKVVNVRVRTFQDSDWGFGTDNSGLEQYNTGRGSTSSTPSSGLSTSNTNITSTITSSSKKQRQKQDKLAQH